MTNERMRSLLCFCYVLLVPLFILAVCLPLRGQSYPSCTVSDASFGTFDGCGNLTGTLVAVTSTGGNYNVGSFYSPGGCYDISDCSNNNYTMTYNGYETFTSQGSSVNGQVTFGWTIGQFSEIYTVCPSNPEFLSPQESTSVVNYPTQTAEYTIGCSQ